MKRLVPNILIILLFLAIIALFIYDHIVLKKPVEDNLMRIILVVSGLIITFVRINKKNPERPLWVYEKIYKRNLENVFVKDKRSRRKLLLGIKLFDKKDYSKAQKSFEKLLPKCKENEDFSAVYFFIGICYERIGLDDDAIEFYELAIDYNPQNISAYNNAGNYYQEKGDIEKAIAYYKKAIDIDGQYVNGYSNLSGCYLQLDDYENTKYYAEKALALDPSYKYPTLNLVVVYALEGDEEKRNEYTNLAVKNGYRRSDVESTIFYFKSFDEENEDEDEE